MDIQKSKIYIGTSVFDMILSNRAALKKCSLLLLEKCKNQEAYDGYISAFTLFELSKRYNQEEINTIITLAEKHHLNYIEYRSPREIDHLAKTYMSDSQLPKEFAMDCFHIAVAAYVRFDFYVCWNVNDIINHTTFRNMINAQQSKGYRSGIRFCAPQYLISKECVTSAQEIIARTVDAKWKAAAEITSEPFETQCVFVQSFGQNLLVNHTLEKITLPAIGIAVARIPVLKIEEVPLKFQVTSFAEEIKEKSLPLTQISYADTKQYIEYHIFRLDILEGQELLKNKQLALMNHMPVHHTTQEFFQILAERSKEFIDWILPQIRTAIDDSDDSFEGIPRDYIQYYSHSQIDVKLANTVDGIDESLHKVKTKALEMAQFITKNDWKNYHGFHFTKPWCAQNNYMEYGENTHLIFEKEGKEIWVLLMNRMPG
jgi:hypothetical protein